MSMVPDPTAVMGRRVGAVAIDGVVVFVPGAIAFSSSLQSFDYPSSTVARDNCDTYNIDHSNSFCVTSGSTMYFSEGGTGGAPLIIFGVSLVMFVLLQGLTGWTVGKLLTGVRTVREDGRPAGILRALVRWLFWIVDSLPVLWLVGIITASTSTGHRRVGDMVAKTFVVRKEAAGRPVAVAGLTSAPPIMTAQGTTPWATPASMPPPPTAQHGPQWDEARGTYIQWDPDQRAWMQWDDTAKAWNRIPGQAGDPTPPPPPPPAPPAADPVPPTPPAPPADGAPPPPPPSS